MVDPAADFLYARPVTKAKLLGLFLPSLLIGVTLFACSTTEVTVTTIPGDSVDGSAEQEDSATVVRRDSGGSDSSPIDAASDAPIATRKTSMSVTIQGVTRELVRAQFGTSSVDAGAGATGAGIYLEAHKGGDPACPSASSPTTDYTLIVANVPRGEPGARFAMADGVRVSYFDFKGDQIADGGVAPFVKATSVTVTVVALEGTSSSGTVELEVDATFANGTAKGRVYGEFCASLSD